MRWHFPTSGESRHRFIAAGLAFLVLDAPSALRADGALYYLLAARGGEMRAAARVVDSLYFANGLALDEQAGYLYVAEPIAGRVLRFRMDVPSGRLTDRTVAAEATGPDNIELDRSARLWIVVPIRNEIVVLDLNTDATRSVFRIATPRSEELALEGERRIKAGTSVLDLLRPDLWEPGPGAITGHSFTGRGTRLREQSRQRTDSPRAMRH